MPAKKRWISWAAVSSKPQAEKISLEEQQSTNRRHIEQHDGHLIAELVIPGESRDIVLFEEAARRIDAYKLLKEAIDTKAFDVLVFLNLGRLGRDIALILAVVRLCQRAGIALYSTLHPPASLEPSDTYIDTLMTALQAAGYQQEISELRRRNRFGMIERISKGNFPAAIPWPWLQRFDVDGTEYLEIDPGGAAALALIADAYIIDGQGAALIARLLNDAGYSSPSGGEWIGASVSYVVRNALRYAGTTEYNRRSVTGREYTVAPSKWPAIWTEETARAILREKDQRWAARGRVRSPHRFSQCV
jgi:DNA invertase Pin-like site-specific DNA recombinase